MGTNVPPTAKQVGRNMGELITDDLMDFDPTGTATLEPGLEKLGGGEKIYDPQMDRTSISLVRDKCKMIYNRKNGKFPSFTTARLQALPTGIVGRAGLA